MKKCIVVLLILATFYCTGCQMSGGFDRHPLHIRFSRHAQCRMECRHVNEEEVKEIIADGSINYSKSDLKEDSCHMRYALEGYSHDSQKLRVIAAECNGTLTVITVIDLGRDWPCNCE